MKKYKKILLLVLVGILLIAGGSFGLYNALVDKNALSIKEKKWIDSNSAKVITVSVPNDLPVFGSTGEGVFFDLVKYIENSTGLDININTVSYLSKQSDYRFEVGTTFDGDDLLLFKDHYVLVSKKNGLISETKTIPSLKPAVINSSIDNLKEYFNTSADNFVAYESFSKITEDLGNGTIYYALVPLNEYKDQLIANNINVLKHVSDLNKYYYFRLGTNKIVNEIFTKKFNSFKLNQFDKSYNSCNYNMFINNLKITEAEEDTLFNKVYHYGFQENRPYEILSGGQYGGITAEYLHSFSKFSNIEFTYKKYKSSTLLAEAAINKKIDLYYNYYNLITNFIDCGALREINYYVIAHNSIDLSMSNLNGLQYRTVYVLKDSYLYDEIKNIKNINIITYANTNELKKIIKKSNIILLDEESYSYYVNNLTNNYSVRYKNNIANHSYVFRYVNNNDTFYKLFSVYTKTIDPQDLLRTGITSYNKVDKKGIIVGTILIIVVSAVIVSISAIFIINKNKKKIKLDTKVKKEDRLKYIDLLTSLKNRNYYNEKLPLWNKNTIYPQACIVMDINRVKLINDTYGHEEGDKQIQAVANILIRTQIDNSELIRTDGNEFLVYLVGYSEKQVLSYMKKLLKEFNDLPHEGSVAIGFSMIDDDTKLIEDAFNEASIQMRENKGLKEEQDEKKN